MINIINAKEANASKEPSAYSYRESVKNTALQILRHSFGPELLELLKNEDTTELSANPNGTVFHQFFGSKMTQVGTMSKERVLSIINTVAAYHDTIINRRRPSITCELPLDGSRFAGRIPPIAEAPFFTIRRKASKVFPLSDYVERSIITGKQKELLEKAVLDRKNLLIIGGTGSGKTTFVNAIIRCMADLVPDERLVLCEDVIELQCSMANYVRTMTDVDSETNLEKLVQGAMKLKPDRIIVGELLGAEALILLDAWNSGHDGGCTTIHATSARKGLDKLRNYITRHPRAPSKKVEKMIVDIIDYVVFLSLSKVTGLKLQTILALEGYKKGEYIYREMEAQNV